jgi:hypothetical protein
MCIFNLRMGIATSVIFQMAAGSALHENAGNPIMWMASSPV